VFCIYLRTNSDLCHLQHKLIGFYNRDKKCLLRGTNWVINSSSSLKVYTNEFHDISQFNILGDKLLSSVCFSNTDALGVHKVTANKEQHFLLKYTSLIRY
jgi:hypothetical protein